MSMIEPPERFYTPYQRRQVIDKLFREGSMSDIYEAAEAFKQLEDRKPDELRGIIAKLKADPT